ncbi:MAG TPA: ECF transporter S component [Bacillota bacterium]
MRLDLKLITRTAILLALTVAAQLFSGRLGQAVTGPLVNGMLFISAYAVGAVGGILIGAITPWVALAYGLVKAPAAAVVPFIMVGNALLVIVFAAFHRVSRTWGRYPGVAVAAVVKFLALAGAVRYLLSLKPAVAAAFGVPQLFTALGGGVIGLVIMAALDRVWVQPTAKKVDGAKE